MAIVARATVALRAAVSLAVMALASCNPAPTAPSSRSPADSPGQSAAGDASPSACIRKGPPPAAQPAWHDRVFYEVFVRSFSDSDGDGVGDLAGLTSKLDYLNDADPTTRDDLGVTGIWLMPVAEALSYHGYDVTDYTAVEHDYGDQAAMRAFVQEAHERGITVIVDLVINHTSRDHPWFQDALAGGPHRDWYTWSESDPHWPAVAGPSPWHRAPNGDYYYGAFWEGMPDLNLRNADVTAEIARIAGVWLDDIGVDGFRIDAAKHLIEVDADHQVNTPETLAWLEDFTSAVHADHPDALIVSEVWDIARTAGSYVPESSDLTFDFGMATATISALQNGRTPPIETALGETLTEWPTNREASFLTNHDQNRVMSQLSGDVPSARLAAFMLLAGPGVPFVYYGEEIGMHGRKPDERIRTPMQWTGDEPAGGFSSGRPWEALADHWKTVNVAAQDADPLSPLTTYRDAIARRTTHPALQTGATLLVDGGAEPVIGWLRVAADETLLVVINVSANVVSDYALSLDDGPLCGSVSADLVGWVNDIGTLPVPAAPEVTATGGLDGYKPFTALGPRAGYVLELLPR